MLATHYTSLFNNVVSEKEKKPTASVLRAMYMSLC